jgi:hypothetical protein
VAQPVYGQDYYITVTAEKIAHEFGLPTSVNFPKNLPKINNHPVGENSPNPVTLALTLRDSMIILNHEISFE